MGLQDLTVVIVNFRTADEVIECVESLVCQQPGFDVSIRVLDNASGDDSALRIREAFGNKVEVLESDVNLGFGAGCNLAVKGVRSSHVLFLNPDTVVPPGFISSLSTFSRQTPFAGIWGVVTTHSDGSINRSFAWNPISIWSLFCQGSGLGALFPRVRFLNPEVVWVERESGRHFVKVVSGCCLLIHTELLRLLRGFDEEFFMYGEDVDLCLRASSFGASPVVDTSIAIVHHGARSESIRSGKLVRLLGAKARLIRRYSSGWRRRVSLKLLEAWPFSRFFVFGIVALFARDDVRFSVWSEVWARRALWLGGDRDSLKPM